MRLDSLDDMELVQRFVSAYIKYWEIFESLPRNRAGNDPNRADHVQHGVCLELKDAILGRGPQGVLALRVGLGHEHPGVRLRTALALEDHCFDDAIQVYLDLARALLNSDGSNNTYGVRAGGALARLASAPSLLTSGKAR